MLKVRDSVQFFPSFFLNTAPFFLYTKQTKPTNFKSFVVRNSSVSCIAQPKIICEFLFSWGYSSYSKPVSINHVKFSLRCNLTTIHFNLSNTGRGPRGWSVDLLGFGTQIEDSLKGWSAESYSKQDRISVALRWELTEVAWQLLYVMTMNLLPREGFQRNIVSLQNNVITLESNTLPARCLWRSLCIGLVLAV